MGGIVWRGMYAVILPEGAQAFARISQPEADAPLPWTARDLAQTAATTCIHRIGD